MRGDTGVRPSMVDEDECISREQWGRAYEHNLRKLIHDEWKTQAALIRHIEDVHPKRPKVSKQHLSRSLSRQRTAPDWPLTVQIVECSTHGDPARQQELLARLAGLYLAATGQHSIKGYDGPVATPRLPVPEELAGADLQAEARRLRRELSETRAQMAETQARLRLREIEVDQLSVQCRVQASNVAAARLENRRILQACTAEMLDVNNRLQDYAARAEAAEQRHLIAWDRYALQHAHVQTVAAAHPCTPDSLCPEHDITVSRHLSNRAPTSWRRLAAYLNAHRERTDQHLSTLSAATGIPEAHLSQILSAEQWPTRDEVSLISTAVGAPPSTVQRMHTATLLDPTTGALGDSATDATTHDDHTFMAIVAGMAAPAQTRFVGRATVAPPGKYLSHDPGALAGPTAVLRTVSVASPSCDSSGTGATASGRDSRLHHGDSPHPVTSPQKADVPVKGRRTASGNVRCSLDDVRLIGQYRPHAWKTRADRRRDESPCRDKLAVTILTSIFLAVIPAMMTAGLQLPVSTSTLLWMTISPPLLVGVGGPLAYTLYRHLRAITRRHKPQHAARIHTATPTPANRYTQASHSGPPSLGQRLALSTTVPANPTPAPNAYPPQQRPAMPLAHGPLPHQRTTDGHGTSPATTPEAHHMQTSVG